jgi:hypothetical protein
MEGASRNACVRRLRGAACALLERRLLKGRTGPARIDGPRNQGGLMSSIMLAALISSWLPAFALILPMSAAFQTNALVVGTLATALAGLSTLDHRARYGAAALAAWTGFMPLLVDASLVEFTLNTCWGVAMVSWLIGPFSQSHAVTRVPAATIPAQAAPSAPVIEEHRAAA